MPAIPGTASGGAKGKIYSIRSFGSTDNLLCDTIKWWNSESFVLLARHSHDNKSIDDGYNNSEGHTPPLQPPPPFDRENSFNKNIMRQCTGYWSSRTSSEYCAAEKWHERK